MALDPAYREQFGMLFSDPEGLRKRIATEEEEDLRLARNDDLSAIQGAVSDIASGKPAPAPVERADAPTGYGALYARRPVPAVNAADIPSMATGLKPDPTVVVDQKPATVLPETAVTGAPSKRVTGKRSASKDPSEVSSSEILDKYFAENFGNIEETPTDDDGDGKPGVTPEDPNAPTPGLVAAQESRKRSNIEIDPEARADLKESRDTVLGKTKEMVESEDLARQATRFAEAKAGKQKDVIEAEALKKQRSLDESFKSKLAKHQRLGEELRGIEVQDPSLWTGETGKDIGTTVGLVLLGILGGPHMLMPQINKILDRDMETQKTRLAKKKADWETDGLLLDRVAKVYDTEEARDNAARLLALQGVERQLQQDMSAAQDPAVRARGEIAIAQLKEELTMREIQQEALTRGEVMTTYAAPKPVAAGGGGGNGQYLKYLKEETEIAKLEGREPRFYVPAIGKYATTEEAAKAANGMAESRDNLSQSAARMIDLHSRASAGGLTPAALDENKRIFEGEKLAVQMQLKTLWQLGVLSDQDFARLDAAVPSISLTDRTAVAALKSIINSANSKLMNKLSNTTLIDGAPPRGLSRDMGKPSGDNFTPEEPGGG